MKRTIATLASWKVVNLDPGYWQRQNNCSNERIFCVDIERIKEIKDGCVHLLPNAEGVKGIFDGINSTLTGLASYIEKKKFFVTDRESKEKYAFGNITSARYIGDPEGKACTDLSFTSKVKFSILLGISTVQSFILKDPTIVSESGCFLLILFVTALTRVKGMVDFIRLSITYGREHVTQLGTASLRKLVSSSYTAHCQEILKLTIQNLVR